MWKRVALVCCVLSFGAVLSGCGSDSSANAKGAESFLVSVDGGETFTPRVSAGEEKTIASINVLSMATSTYDAQVMYLGTMEKGIFVTYTGGEMWQQITFPPKKVYGLAVDAVDANTLYASGMHEGFARVYRSFDGGENWEEIYTEPTKEAVITSLEAHPTDGGTVYVGMSTGVIIKTTDGGAQWRNVADAKKAITQIAFDAGDANTVYFVLYQSGLLKTRDGGTSIEDFSKHVAGSVRNVGDGTRRSSRVESMAADPINSGRIYVGTNEGVYRSDDYGTTWRELNTISSAEKLAVKVIAVNPHNTDEIVYSVARTLYRSGAGQTQWTPVQLSTSRVASVLHYDPVTAGTLFVGMGGAK